MADDKKPRDRDVRRDYHTPIGGVPVQRKPENFETHTPVQSTPVLSRTSSDELLVNVERRSRETKNASITTLDRVNDVRRELREDIGAVNEKVDGVVQVVGDMRQDLGELKGAVGFVVTALDEARVERQQHNTVKVTAELSNIKVAELERTTEVDLKKQRAAVRNQIALKLTAAIGVIGTTVLGLLAAGKC